MNRRPGLRRLRAGQRGAAAVEFAFVAIVFFMLLIGIVEMGRVLFTWNAAVEATRYGARIAVVCGCDAKPAILERMKKIMPALADENVKVCYADNFAGAVGTEGGCLSACSADTNQQVSVSIQDLNLIPMIPLPPKKDPSGQAMPWILSVPPFTTTLPRESMNSIAGHPNPMCAPPLGV